MSALPDPNWPPSIGKNITKLALIERERELLPKVIPKSQSMEYDYIHGKIDNIIARKKEIQFTNVFDPIEGDKTLRILMDGAPGVGKTTLVRKASIDWAKGEFLQQYDLVVLVPLREVKNRVKENIQLEHLFPADSKDLKQRIISHVQDTSGKGILLIFDGFDELSDKERLEESLFLDIIRGEVLCQCSVLVTSRPYASNLLKQLQCIVRHVEVLGFTEKQIAACIRQNLKDENAATELICKLKERVDIASLCYIPLNCAIMIHVYMCHCFQLPETLTDLFEKFIVDSLKRRALRDLGIDCLTRVTVYELPEPVRHQFLSLCHLAYNGMLEDKFIFSDKELRSIFPDCVGTADFQASCLDQVTSVITLTSSGHGEEMYYQFLHLSIQEYLCAFYVAVQLSENDQILFMQKHLDDNRFHLVLLFLAGLTKFKTSSHRELISQKQLDLKSKTMPEPRSTFMFIAHLIYESQNLALYRLLYKCLTDKTVLYLNRFSLSLFDCMVIAHFLCIVNQPWSKLSLVSCSISKESLMILSRVCNSYGRRNTSFVNIDFSENNPNLIANLSALPARWMQNVKRLTLHCSQPLDNISEQALVIPELSHVNNISMSTPLGEDSKITCKVNSKTTILQRMTIGDNLFDSRLDPNTIVELRIEHVSVNGVVDFTVKALKVVKPVLRTLTLIDTGLKWSDGEKICHLLKDNKSLQTLDFSDNPNILYADKSLGQAVKQLLALNKTLEHLNLYGCVNKALLQCIAEGLMTKKCSLKTLGISNKEPQIAFMSTFLTFLLIGHNSLNSLSVSHLQPSSKSCMSVTVQHKTQSTSTMLYLETFNGEHTTVIQVDKELVLETLCDMLGTSSSLKRLTLHSSVLNDQLIVRRIADGISQSANLQNLKLTGYDHFLHCVPPEILNATHHSSQITSLCVSTVHLTRSNGSATWKLNTDVIDEFTLFFQPLSKSKMSVLLCWSDVPDQMLMNVFNLVCDYNYPVETIDLLHKPLSRSVLSAQSFSKRIEKMLSLTATLRLLDFSNCGINDIIARSIAAGLIKNNTLEILKLDNNPLISVSVMSEVFGSANANKTVYSVQVFNTELLRNTAEDLWVVSVMKSEQGLAMCKDFSNIHVRMLNFSQCKMTSDKAIRIFHLLCDCKAKVDALNLSDNLDCGEENVDEFCKAIEMMLTLTESLKSINLKNCGIGDVIARGIAAGLKKNDTLESFNIDGNKISVPAMRDIVVPTIDHKALVNLSLFNTELFMERSCYSRKWMIRGTICRSMQYFEMCAFCRYSNFEIINLDFGMTGFFASCATKFNVMNLLCDYGEMFEISYLCLANTFLRNMDNKAVADTIQKMLSQVSTLVTLDLSNCGIEDTIASGIEAGLMKNCTLQNLYIDNNDEISVGAMSEIFRTASVHRNLKCLQLFNTSLASNDCALAMVNKTWHVTCTSDVEFLSLLKSFSNILLQKIDLSLVQNEHHIPVTHIMELLCDVEATVTNVDLSGVDFCNLNQKKVDVVVGKFLRRTSFTSLNLTSCNIDDRVARSIAAGLVSTSTRSLDTLILNDNPISVNAMNEVFVAVNSNCKHSHVKLEFFNCTLYGEHSFRDQHIKWTFEHHCHSIKGLIFLSKTSVPVHTLELSRRRKWRSAILSEPLNEMFASNKDLKVVNADKVDKSVFMTLMKGLHFSSSVQTLSCDDTALDDDMSKALAEMLESNEFLTHLSVNKLSGNFNDHHIEVVARALITNSTLLVFNVSRYAKVAFESLVSAHRHQLEFCSHDTISHVVGVEFNDLTY